MDLLSVFKRYFSRDKTDPMQSDEDPFLYREFPDHPSTGLDIQRIYALFRSAEQGDIQAQSDLFTDMEERDGHLFAELSKRKRALLTLPFGVKAPPQASDAERKIAAEAEWWIRQLPGWRELLMDMLDAIGHGFSCIEIEWGQKGDLWLPSAFHKRPARAFTMPQDDLEQINLRRGGANGEPLWPLGWVVHRHKSKSAPVAQSGLFRVLVWTYLFKNLSARDWAQFLNLYGLPFRIGKYDSSMGEAERRRLLMGIRMLAREGGGIIPKEASIELVSPSANQSAPFFAMVDWCEKVQSKVILGGTLTSQADGKSPTNALGNVHNEVRHDLLVGDAHMVADTLTQSLLWPILAINGRFTPPRAPGLSLIPVSRSTSTC
jgi:Mu-like prophage protein gp29